MENYNSMLRGFEEDEISASFSIQMESLTLCAMVPWQENIKMKMFLLL